MSSSSEVTEAATTRGGLINALASLGGVGLTFALTFVVTRTYGAALTGVFFGASAAFMIVATTTKLGAETGLVLFVARLRSAGRLEDVPALLRTALGPVLAVSTVGAFVLAVLAPQLAAVVTDPELQSEFSDVLRVLAPFVVVWAVSLCLLGATRGAGTMAPTAYALQLLQPAAQLALVGAAASTEASMRWVALAWASPLLVTALAAGAALARILRQGHSNPSSRPDDAGAAGVDAPTFWSFAIPRGVSGSLQMGLDRIGVLLVGALGGAALAGQWAVIMRLIGIAQRIFHAIGQALNPRLSALAGRRDWAQVSSAMDRTTQWTLLVLAPVVLGLVFFPTTALSLFGSEFESAATGLRVAAIVVGVASMLAHADNLLLMAGESKRALINTAAALVVSIGLYSLLVDRFEAVGAAFAFGGGVAVYRLAAAWQIARLFQVQAAGAQSLRVLGLATTTVAGPLLLIRLAFDDTLRVAIVAAVVTGVGYVIGALLMRRSGAIELSLS